MSLKKKIEEKLNEALKAKDKNTYPTLRLVVSAIKDAEIAGRTKGQKEMTDSDINTILKKTEYVVSTNENIYSMFNIESINNGATIIYDKKITDNTKKNYGFIVPINFECKKINLPKKRDYHQNELSFIQNVNNHKNDFLKLFNNIIS